MLGKLTKYELLTSARMAFPTYIIVLVLAAVGRLLTWLTSRQYIIDSIPSSFVKIIKLLSSLISATYVILFLSLLIITIFMAVYRFYKNFFTDEGYLMLTLPVRTSSLIFSKLFSAWVWVLLSAIVAVASLAITLGHFNEIIDPLKDLWTSFQDMIEREEDFLKEQLGVPLWVFIVELVIFAIAYLSRFILGWFTSVSFGMLISKKHRIIGTLVAYFLIFIATVIINSIYLGVITSIVPEYNEILAESTGKALQISLVGSTVIHLLFSTALFSSTAYIMKNKLNMD